MNRRKQIERIADRLAERERKVSRGVNFAVESGIDGVSYNQTYSTRGPNDVVISGPIGAARGPGRAFESQEAALAWAREKYGEDRVTLLKKDAPRWAILVKNLLK